MSIKRNMEQLTLEKLYKLKHKLLDLEYGRLNDYLQFASNKDNEHTTIENKIAKLENILTCDFELIVELYKEAEALRLACEEGD